MTSTPDTKPITEAELKEMEVRTRWIRIYSVVVSDEWQRLIAEVRRLRETLRASWLQQRECWWFCIGCEEGENANLAVWGTEEEARTAFRHSPDCPIKALLA